MNNICEYCGCESHDCDINDNTNTDANNTNIISMNKKFFKQTPLHIACESGEIYKVIELLNSGVNINAKDGLNHTPVDCAAAYNHKDIVVELLNRGAILPTLYPYNKNPDDYVIKDKEMIGLIRQTMVDINLKKIYRIVLLKILFNRYKKDFLDCYYLPNGKGSILAKNRYENSSKSGIEIKVSVPHF